jgi:hypothetical protein
MGRALAAMIGVWLSTVTLAGASGLDVSVEEAEVESLRLARAGLDLLLERQKRLLRVGDRIRSEGVALCGDRLGPVTGIVATTWSALPLAFRDAAYDAYGVDDFARVLAVLPDSAGAEGGIRAGDTILSIDGEETHSAADLQNRTWSTLGPSTALRIERDGSIRDLELPNRVGCTHSPELFMLDTIDAYTDDSRIAISSGMLRFLESDDELAVLLGHELAHVLLGHPGRGTRPEAEADELGLYLAARAGYDVSVAADLARRLGRESPGTLESAPGDPHADPAQRAAALERAAAEIARLRGRGEPLVPSFR